MQNVVSARNDSFHTMLSFTKLSKTAMQSFFLACSFGSIQADEWSQYGGPARNFSAKSVSQEKSIAANFWRIPMVGGDAAAVVHQDRIIVSSVEFEPDGTDAHRVICVERGSGKTLWDQFFQENSFLSQDISERYPVRPISTPCIVGDQVVHCGFGGSVRSLSLASGSQNWCVDLVHDFSANPIQYGYACSPWSDGKQVVVACGGDQALLLSLNLSNGSLNWKCGSGLASYASPIVMTTVEGVERVPTNHLVYAAGDKVIGVDPKNGNLHWQYTYPSPGLTNAATPISVAPGKLLIGGQGVNGTRLLSIARNGDSYSATEVWHNSKLSPFYCNWLQLQSVPNCVIGFMGKTMTALDWTTGEVYWQKRGWTDTNVVNVNDKLLAVRGDGFVGLVKADEKGLELLAGDNSIRDRVWTPPTVVDQQILLVGRSGLVSLPIGQLQKMAETPSGSEVTSMDAMYGSRPERIQKLIGQSKIANRFTIEDYRNVSSDKTAQISEGDTSAIIKNLLANQETSIALAVATDWVRESPHSIPAWDQYLDLLRVSGKGEQADIETKARMVDVRIEVALPPSSQSPGNIYLMGNARSIGAWNPMEVRLQPTVDGKYGVSCQLPRGDFQFKFTGGSIDTVEVRSDGRSISNRRHRITAPTTLNATVQAWKK